ncbi:MAG: hypothetical protein QOK40_1335 [Miltoncostaeaceae bacterium]|nr:hypothetical protein [Miltoncostaeaceae bacterium]
MRAGDVRQRRAGPRPVQVFAAGRTTWTAIRAGVESEKSRRVPMAVGSGRQTGVRAGPPPVQRTRWRAKKRRGAARRRVMPGGVGPGGWMTGPGPAGGTTGPEPGGVPKTAVYVAGVAGVTIVWTAAPPSDQRRKAHGTPATA